MAMTMTVSDYPLAFRSYIIKSVQFSLSRVRMADNILARNDREQALHALSYALKLPEAWPDARDLLLAMAPKMEQLGFLDEWLPYLEYGLRQSQLQGDCDAEAELHFQLGLFYQLRGDYAKAHASFEAAAAQHKTLSPTRNLARALNKLAYVARHQRRFDEAASLINQALELLSEEDAERAYSYLVFGTIELDKHNWQQAADLFQQSLELWQKEKDHRMMAWSLTNLGAALRPLQRDKEAIAAYEQAISLLKKIHDPVHLAGAQMNLGNVYLTQREARGALEFYRPAEVIFRQTGDTYRLALVYLNMGMAYRQLEAWEKAENAYRASIKQWGKLGNIAGLVNVLDGLGLLYLNRRQPQEAKKIFRQALTRLAEIADDPAYEYLLDMLEGHLQKASG